MIPAIRNVSYLSFGNNELKSARDAYSDMLDQIRDVQVQQQQAEPSKEEEKKLDIKA